MSFPDIPTVCIKSLVFFDLETTGLPSDHAARITELNFCGVDRSQFIGCKAKKMPRVTNRLNLCIDPSRPIDPVATDMSKLDNANLGQQSKFDENVFNIIVSFLDRLQKPICLIAHNGTKFDFPIFNAEIAQLGKEFPQDVYCADSLEIFGLLQGISTGPPKAKKMRKTKATSLKLNEIYQRIYKKKPETLHEAEADVKMLFLSAIATPQEFLNSVDRNAVPLKKIPKCWYGRNLSTDGNLQPQNRFVVFRYALICDAEMDSLRLGRQTWASIIDNAGHFSCPTSTSFTVFQISNDTEMHPILDKVRKFDGVVLAATRCQIYDFVESSMKKSSTIPLLRLHFSPCPAIAGSHTERIDLHRLNDTNRDTCGSLALSMWLQHRICSSFMDNDTIRLLLGNNVTLDVSRELQDCSGLDELQWSLYRQPVAFQDKFTTETAEWHRLVNGQHLRLASLERPPFVVFERDFNGVITAHKGYCYEIIHSLQQFYNFTYEVVFPADNTFGKELSNGSWDGMMRDILEQNADIGLGPFSVTHSRYKVVDFSVGFHEEATTILIPPPAEESRLLACTKPFRSEVWIALILFVIVLPAIFWKCLKLLQILNQETSSPTLANQFFFVLGVLIGQSGQRLVSTGFWYRFLGALWCLSAVVFASAYVGILVSFLRFPKLTPIINKLEDLPESQLKWSVLRGTALESLFTEATTGVYKTIGDGLLTTRGSVVDNGLDGIYGVINGSFAYIEEKSYLESFVAEDYEREGTCRLSLTYEDFFKVNLAFPLPKASPLKPLMDKKIMQIVETGLGNYWKKMYWPQSVGKCPGISQPNAGPKSLRLSDLQGAFLIQAMGFVLASFIFLAEKYYNYFRPCRPNRPVSYIR